MNDFSRRRALLLAAYAGLNASLWKVALAQPSAESKWEIGRPPLPKAMGEVGGCEALMMLAPFARRNACSPLPLVEAFLRTEHLQVVPLPRSAEPSYKADVVQRLLPRS